MLSDQQQYRYMTVDDMKSLGDDSMQIDVTSDERGLETNRHSMAPSTGTGDIVLHPHYIKDNYTHLSTANHLPDNVDINRSPINVGNSLHRLDDSLASLGFVSHGTGMWRESFLVSFLVDARGGAMRGCRHSGVRVIVPPRKAAMPMRVTCRYLRREKLTNPPPLMEGEALASRILELGPIGAKFLGPVIIEVPHFASLRGKEREIVVLRSDNGDSWREHTLDASEEAVQDVLNDSFEGDEMSQLEDLHTPCMTLIIPLVPEMSQLEDLHTTCMTLIIPLVPEMSQLEDLHTSRITRVLTTDFPHYFAVISRTRQEVHAIGPEGGMVSSSVVPQVQAVFPPSALTKKIRVGIQALPIHAELAAKLLGNRVAVSPIVTVEPRRRKFHKPITLTIPLPQAANKGMINQYSGDAPTLRLLCSITGPQLCSLHHRGGTTRAQWEDVTGSTPLTFVKDCVTFTTTVSARFWLMDCRNIGEATKMATELYREATHPPFMAKFVVFAKRIDLLEARLRVFCMTDDKEDKTLEHQEHFTEVAKSRDVEVLEGKTQFIEFAGNLIPVMKSGDQLQLGFRAFKENRLPFTVRVKDQDEDTVGRILFMREQKVAKGEATQTPICTLNIVLPDNIVPEGRPSEPDLLELERNYSFLRDGIAHPDTIHRADIRLSDISNLLGPDWVPLAYELGLNTSDINLIKSEYPGNVNQQGMVMLRLWLQSSGNKATGNTLEKSLRKIDREDIVNQCIFNIELVTDDMERAVAKVHLDQSGFDNLREELGPSRDATLRRNTTLNDTYDEPDIMKESESVEDLICPLKKSSIIVAGEKRDKYAGEEKDLGDVMEDSVGHKAHERFQDGHLPGEESEDSNPVKQEILQGISQTLERLDLTTPRVVSATVSRTEFIPSVVSTTPPPSPEELRYQLGGATYPEGAVRLAESDNWHTDDLDITSTPVKLSSTPVQGNTALSALGGRDPEPSEKGREFINSRWSSWNDPFPKSFGQLKQNIVLQETKQRARGADVLAVIADSSLLFSLVDILRLFDGNEDNLDYLPSPQGRWEEGAPPSQHAQSGTTLDSVVVSSHEAVTTSTPSAHHLVKTIRRSSKNLLPGSTPVSASPGVHDIEWDFGSDEEKPPGSVIVKTTVTKISQEGHREFLDDLKGPPKIVEVTKTITKVKHPNEVSNDSSLTSISDMSGEDFSKETKDPIKLAALGKQLSLTLLEGERRYLPDAPAIIKNSDVDDGYTYEEIQCYTDVNNAHNNVEDGDKRYGSMMVNSDSDSDSRGSPQPVPKSRSFSTRKTLGSSSGSDIALHEGADLSEDEHAASRWYDSYWRRSWWLPACFLLALFACVAMHGTDSPYFLAVHRFLPHAAAAAIPTHVHSSLWHMILHQSGTIADQPSKKTCQLDYSNNQYSAATIN
ncbi:unnamed protein product [Timema podura]|uniref:Ankyrin n=1 Tax=Timema podura TaxID=61482 RepID=A0ABN7NLD0_TIMPD|nr:unnamed protein product [Timema podura]